MEYKYLQILTGTEKENQSFCDNPLSLAFYSVFFLKKKIKCSLEVLESDNFIDRKCNNKKKGRNGVTAIIWVPHSISRICSSCLLFNEIFDKSTYISIN